MRVKKTKIRGVIDEFNNESNDLFNNEVVAQTDEVPTENNGENEFQGTALIEPVFKVMKPADGRDEAIGSNDAKTRKMNESSDLFSDVSLVGGENYFDNGREGNFFIFSLFSQFWFVQRIQV